MITNKQKAALLKHLESQLEKETKKLKADWRTPLSDDDFEKAEKICTGPSAGLGGVILIKEELSNLGLDYNKARFSLASPNYSIEIAYPLYNQGGYEVYLMLTFGEEEENPEELQRTLVFNRVKLRDIEPFFILNTRLENLFSKDEKEFFVNYMDHDLAIRGQKVPDEESFNVIIRNLSFKSVKQALSLLSLKKL